MIKPTTINFSLLRHPEKGATSVEYAVITVAIIITIIGTVLFLVNPSDPDNSILPKTYTGVANNIGTFSTFDPNAN